jgi:hypothetical protein
MAPAFLTKIRDNITGGSDGNARASRVASAGEVSSAFWHLWHRGELTFLVAASNTTNASASLPQKSVLTCAKNT